MPYRGKGEGSHDLSETRADGLASCQVLCDGTNAYVVDLATVTPSEGRAAVLKALTEPDTPGLIHLTCHGVPQYEPVLSVQSDGQLTPAELLGWTLRLHEAKTTLDEAPELWSAAGLTRQLLSSSEEETGLPAITTPLSGSTSLWGYGPLPTPAVLAQAAAAVRQLWHVAVALLDKILNPPSIERGSPAPCLDSSPCGVIKLASPRVPRAPQGPAVSTASPSPYVLAA